MSIIGEPLMHKFKSERNCVDKPGGISGLVLLCESHASIHTYPETGKMYADIFSCKDLDKDKNIGFIKLYEPHNIDMKLISRDM
tara:strand:+ start:1705 stop:1956 length:252 start_codon:yes stop_codon:yes gene_type:complete